MFDPEPSDELPDTPSPLDDIYGGPEYEPGFIDEDED